MDGTPEIPRSVQNFCFSRTLSANSPLSITRAASTADVETVQIEPGTYRITLPANYAHELPSKMDIYGEPDDVIVHFEKIK